MPRPEGNLTATQHRIMEAVWQRGSSGATVTEIWQAVSAARQVGRTTVLNLVDRLQRRGWLVRRQNEKPYRYLASLDREATAALVAGDFVDGFFGGSASNLVMNLLGSGRLTREDVQRLQRLLECPSSHCERKEGEPS